MNFDTLKGKTLASVRQVGDDRIVFETDGGETFALYHSQDCCESVAVEDIVGDLTDLLGSPILEAEEAEASNETPAWAYEKRDDESFTWTFYKLGTVKGSVTIRWYGASNGYYSESVSFNTAD